MKNVGVAFDILENEILEGRWSKKPLGQCLQISEGRGPPKLRILFVWSNTLGFNDRFRKNLETYMVESRSNL